IMVGADRLMVAGIGPGTVWAYDTSAGLTQLGAPLNLGANHHIRAFADVPRGTLVDAAHSDYNMSTHNITGHVSTFRFATPAELASGGAGVRYAQTFTHGGDLTDV